jgi:hypothetical protein
VIESLFRGVDLGHYELGAFAIMANHVPCPTAASDCSCLLLKSKRTEYWAEGASHSGNANPTITMCVIAAYIEKNRFRRN